MKKKLLRMADHWPEERRAGPVLARGFVTRGCQFSGIGSIPLQLSSK
jgi:hypothetical protein